MKRFDSIYSMVFYWVFHPLFTQLEKIMADIDDLNTAQAAASADFDSFVTEITADVADLKSQIVALQNANQGVNLAGPIAAATALDTKIKAALASFAPVVTPDPPVVTPDPPVATTPVVADPTPAPAPADTAEAKD